MSFDWSHYYYLAQELAGEKPRQPANGEAKLRAAMSRGYYAAHWVARNYLKKKHGFEPSKRFEHGEVWGEFLKGEPDYPDSYIEVGQNLQALYDFRAKADYRGYFPDNLNSSTKMALRLAKKIIETIEGWERISR